MKTFRARGTSVHPLAAVVLVAALLLGFAPGRVDDYRLYLLTIFCRLVVMAQAWNLLAGYTGLLSLGNHAFMGLGGYAMTLVLIHWEWSFVPAMFAGAAVAAVLGTLAYLPLFRLRQGYFAISTLLLGLVVQAWAVNWDWVGASAGVSIPPGAVPGATAQFRLAWGAALLASFAVAGVLLTRGGLYLRAVRDDEDSAEATGVNPLYVKTVAVAISAGLSGLAGGLLAMQLVTIDPKSGFGLGLTLDMVVMVIVGGLGTRLGPVVGAATVIVLEQVLQDYLAVDDWVFVVVKAALLIVAVRVAPRGLVGLRAMVAGATQSGRGVTPDVASAAG